MQPIVRKFIKSPYPSEREIKVLKARFGIDTKVMTLEEIGEELGVSRQRVKQIEERLLDKIKIFRGLDKPIARE